MSRLPILVLLNVLVPYNTAFNVGLLASSEEEYLSQHINIATYAVAKLAARDANLVIAQYPNTAIDMFKACCRLVKGNVSTVISIGTSTDTAIQADIFSDFNIPLLSVAATDPFLANTDRDYLIRMSPSDNYQSRAIFGLLNHFEWTEVSILASADSYGINGLLKLQHLIAQSNNYRLVNVLYFHAVANISEFNSTGELQVIKDSLSRVIVLNCDVKYGKKIFAEADKMGLMGEGFAWIVTDGISTQPEGLKVNGTYLSYYEGLLGTRPAIGKLSDYKDFKDTYLMESNRRSNQDLTIYTMMTYDAIQVVSEAISQIPNPIPPASTCETGNIWAGGAEMLSSLSSITYPGITGQISFTEAGESEKIVYDILNFRFDMFQPVGKWSNSSGIELNGNVMFLGDKEDVPGATTRTLQGQHLRLGVKAEAPFTYYKSSECEGDECWSGYCIDIVQRLSKDLNFTYEYLKPIDNKWGGYNATMGEWNGIVGELKSRVIDMAAAPMSANSIRKEVIDFSVSFMDAGIIAVVKGESGKKNKFFFLSPFDPAVWIAILMVNFAVTGLICLFNRLSPFGKYGAKIHAMQICSCIKCKERRELKQREGCTFDKTKKFDCLIKKTEHKDTKDDLSLYNSIWLIGVGLVGKASGTPTPYCMSSRFILFSWWFFMLIIIKMYTANLTAFMTVTKLGISLNTVKDLLDQEEFEWGLIESRNPENLLLNHIDPVYGTLVKKGTILKSLEEALEKVREGKFVFIDESPIIAHNLKSDCDIFPIGDEFQTFEYAFGFPKNVPYTNIINKYIMKYREEGFMDSLWQKWSTGDQQCSNSKIAMDGRLDMDTLAGIFYTVIVAAGIGLTFIVIELIYASVIDSLNSDKSFWCNLRLRLTLKLDDIIEEWFGVHRKHQPVDNGDSLMVPS